MKYACEVQECTSRTDGNLCEGCRQKAAKNHIVVMCSRCGIIVKLIKGDRKVEFVEGCYLCSGKGVRKKPWEI